MAESASSQYFGAGLDECFLLSKEHCRRPHVPSSLETLSLAGECCLSWLTPPSRMSARTKRAAERLS